MRSWESKLIYFISQKYRENQKPAVDKIKEPILDNIVVFKNISNFNFSIKCHLWFLGKFPIQSISM